MKQTLRTAIVLIALMIPSFAQAITVSITSTVQVNNAPAGGILNVQCGTVSGGPYPSTKQFYMGSGGVQTFNIGTVIPTTGNWFCIANFINQYGSGSNTTEFALTITAPEFAVPTFMVLP